MKQAGEEILAVQSAGLISLSGLARTDEFADATSVAISGGGSARQSGGSVRLHPGDGTSSASVQLLGANLGGHEAAGGVQISGDGAVGVAARGGQSVHIQSGAGLAGTPTNNTSSCHSRACTGPTVPRHVFVSSQKELLPSGGGVVRLTPGSGTNPGFAQLADAAGTPPRLAVDATGQVTLTSRSDTSQHGAGAAIGLRSGEGTTTRAGAIVLAPGDGNAAGRVALTDVAGGDRVAVYGSGTVTVNANADASLRLLHGSYTVVEADDDTVSVSAETTGESDSNINFRSGSDGDIVLQPGRGLGGDADGKIVFQDAHGGVVMESTGEGAFHVHQDIIFDSGALSVTDANRVGVGTTAPSTDHVFDVSDHVNVADKLEIADVVHVDASRQSVGVGIGSSIPSAVLDVVASSDEAGLAEVFGMGNLATADSMRDTATGLRFSQMHGSASAVAARLAVGAESDWADGAGSARSYLTVQTAQAGTAGEKFRVGSDGGSRLHGDVTVGGPCQWAHVDLRCLEEESRRTAQRAALVASSDDQAAVSLRSAVSGSSGVTFSDLVGNSFAFSSRAGDLRMQSQQSQMTISDGGHLQLNAQAQAVSIKQLNELRLVLSSAGAVGVSSAALAEAQLSGGSGANVQSDGLLVLSSATQMAVRGGTGTTLASSQHNVEMTAAEDARFSASHAASARGEGGLLAQSVNQHAYMRAASRLDVAAGESILAAAVASIAVASASAMEVTPASILAVQSDLGVRAVSRTSQVEATGGSAIARSMSAQADLLATKSVLLTSSNTAKFVAGSKLGIVTSEASLHAMQGVLVASRESRLLGVGPVVLSATGTTNIASAGSVAASADVISMIAGSGASMSAADAAAIASPICGAAATAGHLFIAAATPEQGHVANVAITTATDFVASSSSGMLALEACSITAGATALGIQATQKVSAAAASANIQVDSTGGVRVSTSGRLGSHAAGGAIVQSDVGHASVSGSSVSLTGSAGARLRSDAQDVAMAASRGHEWRADSLLVAASASSMSVSVATGGVKLVASRVASADGETGTSVVSRQGDVHVLPAASAVLSGAASAVTLDAALDARVFGQNVLVSADAGETSVLSRSHVLFASPFGGMRYSSSNDLSVDTQNAALESALKSSIRSSTMSSFTSHAALGGTGDRIAVTAAAGILTRARSGDVTVLGSAVGAYGQSGVSLQSPQGDAHLVGSGVNVASSAGKAMLRSSQTTTVRASGGDVTLSTRPNGAVSAQSTHMVLAADAASAQAESVSVQARQGTAASVSRRGMTVASRDEFVHLGAHGDARISSEASAVIHALAAASAVAATGSLQVTAAANVQAQGQGVNLRSAAGLGGSAALVRMASAAHLRMSTGQIGFVSRQSLGTLSSTLHAIATNSVAALGGSGTDVGSVRAVAVNSRAAVRGDASRIDADSAHDITSTAGTTAYVTAGSTVAATADHVDLSSSAGAINLGGQATDLASPTISVESSGTVVASGARPLCVRSAWW